MIFDKELKLIKNETYRKDIKTILDNLPIYFYEVPASSTGKYHPSFSLGEGGLVRHVKATIKIAQDLLVLNLFSDITDDEKDLIFGSLLVHDGLKYGYDYDVKSFFKHPLFISNFILELLNKNMFESDKIKIIETAHIVSTHMGQWNTSKYSDVTLPLPSTHLDYFVHLCDYISSRKYINMEFDDDMNVKEV